MHGHAILIKTSIARADIQLDAMDSAPDEALIRAIRPATRKAQASDPGLLHTARLMCHLSTAVYNKDELVVWSSADLQAAFSPLTRQAASFTPESDPPSLVAGSPASEGALFQDLGRQYGIWKVEGLGIIVAFSGTQEALDHLCRLEFRALQGASRNPHHPSAWGIPGGCRALLHSNCREMSAAVQGCK